MIDILAHVPNLNDGTSFYRGAGPLSHLRQNFLLKKRFGQSVVEIPAHVQYMDATNWKVFRAADIVMLQRPYLPEHLKIAEQVKKMGRPLWVDHDDLITDLECDNVAYLSYSEPSIQTCIKSIMQLADVMTVSTRFLKDKFKEFNANIQVVPNAFDQEMFKWRDNGTPRKKIVFWRGGGNHGKSLMEFKDAIIKNAHKHTDWEWHFMGDQCFFITEHLPEGRVALVQWTPDLPTYFRYLYEAKYAVQIVPLSDTPFNRGKSCNAYMEGTMADAVVIAPNWEEWQVPGAVNYTDVDHFSHVLDKVLSNYDDVKKTRDMAWRFINSELALKNVNTLRAQLIENFL